MRRETEDVLMERADGGGIIAGFFFVSQVEDPEFFFLLG